MKTALSVVASIALTATLATAETPARPRPVRTKPKPAAASPSPIPVQTRESDGWTVTKETSAVNGKPVVTALLRAEAPIVSWVKAVTPTLVVSCQTPLQVESLPPYLPSQPGLEVYIVTGTAATLGNEESRQTIHVRFDGQPVETWGAGESTDRQALFIAPFYATKAVITHRTLAQSQTMHVEFTPLNGSPVVARFDVRGFARHVDEVLAACPPVDRTKWRFAPGQAPRRALNAGCCVARFGHPVRGRPSRRRRAVPATL